VKRVDDRELVSLLFQAIQAICVDREKVVSKYTEYPEHLLLCFLTFIVQIEKK
jgi:hypothetical protein